MGKMLDMVKVVPRAAPRTLLRSLPLAKQCSHNTGENGRAKAGCTTCVTYGCSLKGTVRVSDCVYCTDYLEKPKPTTESSTHDPTPLTMFGEMERWQNAYHENRAGGAGISWEPIRFDHTNLHPEIPGIRFNASIIESGEGYLYAWRSGWSGSRIGICRLDRDFQPIPKEWAILELNKKGIVGHEDPRLFRLNGHLHLWYIAYGGKRTSVKFCRINESTLKIEDEFFPQIPNRQHYEKNHAYFDYQGIAHAVYDSSPNHRIIKVEGNSATHAYSTPFHVGFPGGTIRGGASPVLYEGNYWHFFHAARYQSNGRRLYSTGVTVFRGKPPFDVLRYTPSPIDEADTRREHDANVDCLFIGGAFFKDGRWITANGLHDRWSEIRFYDHDLIESQLVDYAHP